MALCSSGLLVAGQPWYGVGFYIYDNSNLTKLAEIITANLVNAPQGRGINQGMVYGLNAHPPAGSACFPGCDGRHWL